jgi:putative intracellular protease/amidase
MSAAQSQAEPEHRMRVDLVSTTPKRVLVVVANPSVSTTLGWPVGFWAAELTHPYFELTERGLEVTIASPDGGPVEMDGPERSARPVEVVGERPDHDGLRQHPGAAGAAGQYSQAV